MSEYRSRLDQDSLILFIKEIFKTSPKYLRQAIVSAFQCQANYSVSIFGNVEQMFKISPHTFFGNKI